MSGLSDADRDYQTSEGGHAERDPSRGDIAPEREAATAPPSEVHDRLGARCGGCGHPASFHPSAEHATAYLASTNGRHAPECSCRKGNEVNQFGAVACRCKATREEVGSHVASRRRGCDD